MTIPSLMTVDEIDDIVDHLEEWLGDDGILHFMVIIENHGSPKATWMEYTQFDHIDQYVPRNTDTQEGKRVRDFLRTLNICKDWKIDDFDTQWYSLISKVVELHE